MSEDKKIYIVKKPIAYLGSRFEAGAEISMTHAEAENIGLEYVELKEGQEPFPATPPDDTAQASASREDGHETGSSQGGNPDQEQSSGGQ